MWIPSIPRSVAVAAVHQLAEVDYSVATRVSEQAARVVEWADAHDVWFVSRVAVDVLQRLDDFGSLLISLVVWIVIHSK